MHDYSLLNFSSSVTAPAYGYVNVRECGLTHKRSAITIIHLLQ